MIKEDRIITRKNLKQLCVDFDLYTLGTSELESCKKYRNFNSRNQKIY